MSQTTLLLLLVALALLPTTQSIAYYAATQFITYRGTLSGTFTSSTSSRSSRSPSNCSSPSYHFTSLPNTTVQIGQNPPWDHNPFYFNIDRPGNEIPSTSSHPCYLPYGCTNDPIFNLFLESAAFACFRVEDGKPCGTIEFDDYYFVPVEILDLNLSSISAIEMEGPGKEGTGKGYAVSGNRSSFVSNGTVGGFGFDFAKPQSLKARENGCEVSDEQIRFNW